METAFTLIAAFIDNAEAIGQSVGFGMLVALAVVAIAHLAR